VGDLNDNDLSKVLIVEAPHMDMSVKENVKELLSD